MNLAILRIGSNGPLVEAVQLFLRGADGYRGVVDGIFGPRTRDAVQDWQRAHDLVADGVVGNATWGSFMAAGLTVLSPDDPDDDRHGANWPPKPANLRGLTAAQRQQVFGELVTNPDPTPDNPEQCKMIRKGDEYRIVEVELPLFIGVAGFPKNGRIFFHAKAARQLQLLVQAWHDAGLLDRVLTWGGSLAVRYVRGSKTTLSPHAWGAAFDVNVAWNGLGVQPALVGRRGSVRELVEIANESGWYWGGHYSRRDGMHFEVAEIR